MAIKTTVKRKKPSAVPSTRSTSGQSLQVKTAKVKPSAAPTVSDAIDQADLNQSLQVGAQSVPAVVGVAAQSVPSTSVIGAQPVSKTNSAAGKAPQTNTTAQGNVKTVATQDNMAKPKKAAKVKRKKSASGNVAQTVTKTVASTSM